MKYYTEQPTKLENKKGFKLTIYKESYYKVKILM